MTAIERAAKKQERLDTAQAKVEAYNRNAEALEPYIKNYWRALSEIWQGKKDTARDLAILEKHGLGEVDKPARYGMYYSGAPAVPAFCWNYNLAAINKQYIRA
jgi:hypothetical protein